MTQQEFEKLPKHEQNYNWAKFLKSNGAIRKLTEKELDNLYQKYIVEKKPLKVKNFLRGNK